MAWRVFKQILESTHIYDVFRIIFLSEKEAPERRGVGWVNSPPGYILFHSLRLSARRIIIMSIITAIIITTINIIIADALRADIRAPFLPNPVGPGADFGVLRSAFGGFQKRPETCTNLG